MNYAMGMHEDLFGTFVTRMRMPMFMWALSLAADGTPRQKVAVLDFATPGVEPEAGKAISRNLVGIVSAEVHVYSAGVGSTFPTASVDRTENV